MLNLDSFLCERFIRALSSSVLGEYTIIAYCR